MNSFHAQKSAFGQRLLTARLNANLSQEKLAEAIGASVRSVQRWERGQAVPQGTSRESLCQVLHLSQEALFGKAGDEDGTAWVSKTWCIPHQRNRFFTGREDLLAYIHQILCEQNPAALTRSCALSGLGGIGKTQVAIEYAYRYTHAYRTVFWLAADSAESVMGSLYQIAEQLELPARQATEQSHMAAAVQRWLAMHSGWLLIGDNVDDLALLRSVVPSVQQGALLLTTRHQALGTFADSLEVPPMSNEEGATLLLRRAKQMNDFPPGVMLSYQEILLAHPAAEELVNLLNGLPLALDQAGAYIEETGCSVREYLHLCRQQRKHILAHRGAHEGAHPSSVATTLRLSVAQIERVSPAAADLLRLCVFLHPEAIPEELLVVGAPYLGPVLGPVLVDPYQFNLALAALRHASLVTRHPVTRTLSVHRLVQAVLQDQMEPAEVQLWGERVAHMLHTAFPGGDFSTWTQCERLLPHVLMCASTIPEQVFEQELVELFHKAGDYLTWRGQYAQAEALFRQALHMQEQSPGSDHPHIATSLFHLAFLSREQGKYDQAETLFHQALTMHERALGPGHPEVARSLTGLANLYTNLGKYEQAEPLYERALHIWEQIPGSKSPEMGWSLNGLAILRKNQGHYEQAEVLYERALRLREETLGPEHPLVAMILNNMAIISQKDKKYEQATTLYQRARRIWEQVGHPDLAYALNNLGQIFREQEQYEQAEAFSQKALSLWEQTLGPEHFLLAHPLNNLAEIAQAQGSVDYAESLFKRALQIREKQLAADHPETATTLACLAALYRDQGKYQQAEPLYQRALALRSRQLGSTHPDTVKLRQEYHSLLERLRKATEVKKQRQQEQSQPGSGDVAPKRRYPHTPSERVLGASEQAISRFRHFLAVCCELNPQAWCRTSDLWQDYQYWIQGQQDPFPLSRRAFTAALKACGCRADRTNTARLWRGIALVKNEE